MIARIPDFYSLGDDKLILQKRLSYPDGREEKSKLCSSFEASPDAG